MKGGEGKLNGLQLLFFNDYVPTDFPETTTNSNNAIFNKQKFLQALARATNLVHDEQPLVDETLSVMVQQLSELFQLSVEEVEKVWELVHSLDIKGQNETLIKDLVISVYEMLAITPEISVEEVTEQLKISLSDKREAINNLHKLSDNGNITSFVPINSLDSQIQISEHSIDIERLLQRFSLMMQSINSEESLKQQAPGILKLLEQFQQLNQNEYRQLTQLFAESDDEWQHVLKELIGRFSKRENLVKRATYSHDSKVTTQDITRWIKHLSPSLFTKPTNINETQTIAPNILKTQTMSPIEQYVIYTQRLDNEQLMGEQLVKQFRQVLQASQFSSTHPLTNQLAITLKPDNLGEMLVRFVEINGEMTVKIIVSSQATKSILEANIHLLKHMFAPHQVSIEKLTDGQEVLPKDDPFLKEEDPHEHPDKEQEDNNEHLTEEKEQLDFHKLLKEFV